MLDLVKTGTLIAYENLVKNHEVKTTSFQGHSMLEKTGNVLVIQMKRFPSEYCKTTTQGQHISRYLL